VDPELIATIGHFHLPDGEFVKIAEPDDDDAECTSGRLAVRVEGEISHVYDELGNVLALEIFHGPFAQTALVESCEESIIRLLFASTAVPPEGGVPEIVVGTMPADVFFLSDMGWGATGLFHARATFFDDTGWNDDVVFDAFDGSMRLLADALGERIRFDDGVDAVLPHGWELADGDPALDIIELVDTESPAAVSITIFPTNDLPPPEPTAEEELSAVLDATVDLWDELDDGRARTSGTVQPVGDHLFTGPEGTRLVRTVTVDGRTVRIVAYTPAGAGAYNQFVPSLVLEQVRVFSAVG
jgi:hypothetical protein